MMTDQMQPQREDRPQTPPSGARPNPRTRPPSSKSPHWFTRESDGSVRFRLRLPPDLASQVEEAAGETALMVYIQRVLRERSAYHIRKRAEVEGVQAPLDVPDPEDLEELG